LLHVWPYDFKRVPFLHLTCLDSRSPTVENDRWSSGDDVRSSGGGGSGRGGGGGNGHRLDDWTRTLQGNERLQISIFGEPKEKVVSGINFDKYDDIPVEATGSFTHWSYRCVLVFGVCFVE
jgi:hypothetical protein